MSKSLCGIDCGQCPSNGSCLGCAETNGRPFGGECMVAACAQKRNSGCGFFSGNGNNRCKVGCEMKERLIEEFNALGIPDMPKVTDLNALAGAYINLTYKLPGGQDVKFWDDSRVYLGNQLEKGGGRCYGLTADESFLLVCEYGENGSDPEIVVFKKRG